MKIKHSSKEALPVPLTPLIGREREVAAVCMLLGRLDVRLLTLTGTGGVGKTRLAMQCAKELLDTFPDGISFVPLAAVYDPDLVLPTIAHTLGLPESKGRSPLESLKVYLRDKHALLLLDNFEHVLVIAPLLVELLQACSQLKALVTSRAVLRVSGEYEFLVSPLALPDLTRLSDDPHIAQPAAVALFIQRVQAFQPDFALTGTNARVVAEVCTRLDGLPLAIELAAARIKLFSPQQLLTRLGHRLSVLTDGACDLPERQRTLRNTLQWSYDLLLPEEQRLFQRLSVFVGGCTLEAVEAVCHTLGGATTSVLERVRALLCKHLLQQNEQPYGEPRLLILETIREYALECLAASGEMEETRRAHAEYYLQLAEEAEPNLAGADQLQRLETLEQEHHNLRAALSYLLEKEEAELSLRLCSALTRFWLVRGYLQEGLHRLEAALWLSCPGNGTSVRAKALCGAGNLSWPLGEVAMARSFFEESVAIYRKLEDKRGLAYTLSSLGRFMVSQGDAVAGYALLEESVTLCREVGDTWTLASSLNNMGTVLWQLSDYGAAQSLLEESVLLYRQVGDKQGIAQALSLLARLAIAQGDVTRAVRLLEESLTLARELNDRSAIVYALNLSGFAAMMRGDLVQAELLCKESLALARELDHKRWLAASLNLLAQCTLRRRDLARAAELSKESLAHWREVNDTHGITMQLYILGESIRDQGDTTQAAALFQEGLLLARRIQYKPQIGWHLIGLATVAAAEKQPRRAALLFGAAEPWLDNEMDADPYLRAEYERSVASVRIQLGEVAFTALWAKGRTMTPEQAIAVPECTLRAEQTSVASQLPTTARSSTLPSSPDTLTAREVEVLRLVALGLTSVQIAEQLAIKPFTVNTHVRSIYSKLGITSRGAATRYAIEHKLV